MNPGEQLAIPGQAHRINRVVHEIAGAPIVIETFDDGTVLVNGKLVAPAGSYTVDPPATTAEMQGRDATEK
jgi:hypothetical protein